MANEKKPCCEADSYIEKLRMSDNRWAERHVETSCDEETGEKVRVTKLYAEPKKELQLEEVVTEKTREEVYERTIDVVDGEGAILERRVEAVSPSSARMQLVENIRRADHNRAMTAAAANSGDCNVTHNQMVDMFVTVINSLREGNHAAPVAMAAAPVIPATSMQAQVATRVQQNETKSGNLWTIGLAVLIVVEAVVLAYIMFA